MPPVKLRTLLLAILAITVVAFSALTWGRALVALEVQSEAHALERVRARALLARAALERGGGQLVATARVLAERPTLQQMVEAGDETALAEFLDRFARDGELRSCAVLRDGQLRAQGGAAVDAQLALRASRWQQGQWQVLVDAAGQQPLLGVRMAARGAEGIEVLLIDAAPVPGAGGDGIGATDSLGAIELVAVEVVRGSFDDPRGSLWNRAVQTATLQAGRVRTAGEATRAAAGAESFEAALPLFDGGGELAALLSVSLPAQLVDAPRQDVGRRLLRDQILLALATAAGLWMVGLGISRNLESLTAAALRIRDGDLQTPVPAASTSRETVELSRAMEQMRVTMQQLTLDLQQQRAESDGVLGGIADGVFAVDRERRIQYISAQAAALLGVEVAQAQGRFCGDVLDPEPLEDGRRPCDGHCPILEARSVGQVRRTEVVRGASGGPRSLVLVSSADPPGRESGPQSRQVQVIREETDQEVSRRLRDNVVANVSHEFRTPLSAQLASVEMLRDRLADHGEGELAPLLGSIERANVRLTRLVDNLLESLSIDAGRATLRRQRVAIEAVCMEAADSTCPLLAQKGQPLAFDFGPDLPAIVGDGPRLVQVFVNLLTNASKYSPPSSTICIGAAAVAGGVQAWVDDEGPGLPPGDRDRLFERFVRAAGEQPGESGLGLGLWLVRSIVERHGGAVGVVDRERGSRFLVTLPIQETK